VRSVALIGPQGSGKSTIGDLFVEHRNYQRHGIADAIKHVAEMAYPQLTKDEMLSVDRYSGKTTVSGRGLLQDIGAALRGVDVLFWLRVWEQDYREIRAHGYGVVVDDVRLPLEVEYLRRMDPEIFIVRIHAAPDVRSQRMGRPLLGTHDVTEQLWERGSVDLDIDTTAMTPEQAYRQITDAMEG